MLIRRVKMINFRGFCNKIIEFKDKRVVLLSASNGIGKTTTIDAIEWCLTGNIGRLKNAFDTRSTNDNERKMNNDGILKNRKANKDDKVKVVLYMFDGQKEILLTREQVIDELNPRTSRVTINESEENAKKFINEYVGDSFYNFHFCDIQKSFNIQSKKRGDLKEFFSEFITDYDEKKQIAKNLEIFEEDVKRYLDEKNNQKYNLNKDIERIKENIKNIVEDDKQIEYPKIKFYLDEKTEIVTLNYDQIISQKAKLVNCGYQVVSNELFKLVKNDNLKKEQAIISDLKYYWKTKAPSIIRAVKIGILKDNDVIENLNRKLHKLTVLSFSKDKIFEEVEFIKSLEIKNFDYLEYDRYRNEIKEKDKLVKNLCSEIEFLTQNNDMLELLSELSVKKEIVIKYRNNEVVEKGMVRCPICGSDKFTTMDKELILKEADDYIRRNGKLVEEKKEKRNLLQKEIENIYIKIINSVKCVVQIEISKLENDISDLKKLNDDVQPYLYKAKILQRYRPDINLEELTLEKIKELNIDIKNQILDKSKEQEVVNYYQKILTVLGYEFKDEMIQQTYEKVKNCISEHIEFLNFSYDIFVSKLNSIQRVLSNQNLYRNKLKLNNYINMNNKLEENMEKLKELGKRASQRSKAIINIVDELSKEEYEIVGPALTKFYKKLAKYDTKNEIRIIQKNNGISLVDDTDKNIVNVLSNGQISVFMLAHFLLVLT